MDYLPGALVRTCIGAFATFDELLLDWSLVSKEWQTHARTEREKRMEPLRRFASTMSAYPIGHHENMIAALCVLWLDNRHLVCQADGANAPWVMFATLAKTAEFGKPLRVTLTLGSKVHARDLIKKLSVVCKTRDVNVRNDQITSDQCPIEMRSDRLSMRCIMDEKAAMITPFDVFWQGPGHASVIAILRQRAPKSIVEMLGDGDGVGNVGAINWIDRDPKHNHRCRCVFKFVKGQCLDSNVPRTPAS